MDIINYGSFAYCAVIILALALTVGIFFLLRNAKIFFKYLFVFLVSLLNLGQHLFKSFVWPHLAGEGFGMMNTAYNMCALIIIVTPIVMLIGSGAVKNFVCWVGIAGGLGAMVLPYWFIGESILSWEVLRFYVCHFMLFLTSSLPLLWGMVKVSYRHFWKMGLFMMIALMTIIINYIVVYAIEDGFDISTMFERLYDANPLMCMHPREGLEWLNGIIEVMTPTCFWESETHTFAPIMWYAIPFYLAITVTAFILFTIIDFKNFRKDMGKLFKVGKRER